MPMKNPVHPGALAKANLDELNLSVAEAASPFISPTAKPWMHTSSAARPSSIGCGKRPAGSILSSTPSWRQPGVGRRPTSREAPLSG